MKKKILLPLIILGCSLSYAQENTKISSQEVRIFNSSPLFLFAGESSDATDVISQEEYKDFNCLKDVNVYVTGEFDEAAVWTLKADRQNCGKEIIVTKNDVM